MGGFGFDLFSMLFPVMFLIVFGFIAVIAVITLSRVLKEKRFNADSPRLTVDARIITKRTAVTHRRQNVGTAMFSYYYATFEFESGDRLELKIPDNEYGYLAEGDSGRLTFKGTEFISFERA